MIIFNCSACDKKLKVKDEIAGKSIKCPCGQVNKVIANAPDGDDMMLTFADEAPASTPSARPKAPTSAPAELSLDFDDEPVAQPKGPASPVPPTAPPKPPGLGGSAATGNDEDFSFDEPAKAPSGAMTYVFISIAAVLLVITLIYFFGAYGKYKATKAHILAVNALLKSDYSTAYKQSKKAVDSHGDWIESYFLAGFCAGKLDQEEEALKWFKKVVQKSQRKELIAAAHSNIAAILHRMDPKQKKLVQEHLDKALEEDPDFRPVQFNLSLLASLSKESGGEDEIAKKMDGLQEVAKSWGEDATSQLQLTRMRTAYKTKNVETFLHAHMQVEAATSVEQEVSIEAGRMAFTLLKGLTKESKNSHKVRLILICKEALELLESPKEKMGFKKSLAPALFEVGSFVECQEILKSVMADEKSLALVQLNIQCQFALAKEAKPEERAKQIPALLGLFVELFKDPESLVASGAGYVTQALSIAQELKDKEKELLVHEAGVAAFPKHAGLHRLFAVFLINESKFQKAMVHLDASLTANPDQEDLKQTLVAFKKPPSFEKFRPSKPKDFTSSPLIYVKIKPNTFAVDTKATEMTLDGNPIKFVQGGSELFYTSETKLEPGEHHVVVKVRDLAGNVAEKTFTFPVDIVPPTAELIKPKRSSTNKRPRIEIQLIDPLSGISFPHVGIVVKNHTDNPTRFTAQIAYKGQYAIQDDELGRDRKADISEDGVVNFTFLRDLAPGKYEVHLNLEDLVGNKATKKITFTVDGVVSTAKENE